MNLKHVTCLISLIVLLVSCKNDTKDSPIKDKEKIEKSMKEKEADQKSSTTKKAIPANNNLLNLKLMTNADTQSFSSSLTSSGLVNVFSDSNKQYTVFAPSNDAFKAIPNEKLSLLFSDRELLSKKMEAHIIEGKLNYSELSAKINSNGGVAKLKTLSGINLKASLNGNAIVIKDNLGNEASVIGDEINAENGVIYIIDKVLTIN